MSVANTRRAGIPALFPTVQLSELTLRKDIDDANTDTLLILRHSDPSCAGASYMSDVIINVHSGVLRVASPFFMRGFDNIKDKDFVENGEEQPKRLKYLLLTPHPYAIQRILYYIYRNDYQNVNEETALLVPIYQEAARLGLNDLKHSVLRLIRSQQSLDILASLSYAADIIGEVELARDCGRILADSAYAVFSGKLLHCMGISGIKSLLECDNLQLDEVQTFTALCRLLDSNIKFVSPYSSSSIGPKEKDLLKHIRFCSMSPNCIDQLRHDNLDSLLLGAALRILHGNPKKPRHFPWIENTDYTCVTYNGLFPVLVVRAPKDHLVSFNPNSGNRKLVTPLIGAIPAPDASSLSFTMGSEREMSICVWAYEVAKSIKGNIAFGIAFSSNDPIDESSRSQFNAMTKNRRIVFYYDFGEDAFKSGYVDASLHRQIKASWTYESSNRKEACTLRQRDIVTVNVVVAAGCITLAVGILGTSMRRSFQIPHRSGCTLGNVIKKPCIFGAPFFMLHDIGDSLSIPELRTEFNL